MFTNGKCFLNAWLTKTSVVIGDDFEKVYKSAKKVLRNSHAHLRNARFNYMTQRDMHAHDALQEAKCNYEQAKTYVLRHIIRKQPCA
ncbi:hypothetical protein [Vibrio sp. 1180_3]|uniref:hypothetical protein n=1 Tax=Vibrio sp. 1180_3 TaxID=2528832 RepID=UPI002406E184|nr:hypothetical protein [Vibrio sp. 1180_3]MDF9399165.1 hypothetical protein [Vibrio sp. 1180_3]